MLDLEREARDWSTYNEHSYRIVLLLLLYVCCSRAHPHFPSQFRKRRLHDFVYLYRKHTKNLVGRQFTFRLEPNYVPIESYIAVRYRGISPYVVRTRGMSAWCKMTPSLCSMFCFLSKEPKWVRRGVDSI